MASAALVVVGVVLVVIGVLAGGSLAWAGLGVVALIAAGVLQVVAGRRP